MSSFTFHCLNMIDYLLFKVIDRFPKMMHQCYINSPQRMSKTLTRVPQPALEGPHMMFGALSGIPTFPSHNFIVFRMLTI